MNKADTLNDGPPDNSRPEVAGPTIPGISLSAALGAWMEGSTSPGRALAGARSIRAKTQIEDSPSVCIAFRL